MAGYDSKIDKLYHMLVDGFMKDLASDDFYGFFLNSVKSGENTVSLNERYVERNIDLRWVESIENAIIPLDNIIRNPQRFIKNEEEVAPIEQVRTVTTEGIRHLAQHTNMIARVEGEEVTPERMLNVLKEESFDTYENRFIYTLLTKLDYFLDKRLEALLTGKDVADRFELKMEGTFSAGIDKLHYETVIQFDSPHGDLSDMDLMVNADTSQLNAMQRIERIRKILYNFESSAFVRSMKGCALVRPPLKMTNVLSKNQNFRKAVDLWVFVESYDDVGYNVQHIERSAEPSEEYLSAMFGTLAFQYLIMKKNSGNIRDVADYAARRKENDVRVIRNNVDEFLDSFDLEVDEIKRIFVERVNNRKRKQRVQYKIAKDIVSRAVALDKERIAAQERQIREQRAKEEQRRRLAELHRKERAERRKRQAEERARVREEERARLAEERARARAEELERRRIERERLREEVKARRAEESRLAREQARLEKERIRAEEEAARRAAEEKERKHQEQLARRREAYARKKQLAAAAAALAAQLAQQKAEPVPEQTESAVPTTQVYSEPAEAPAASPAREQAASQPETQPVLQEQPQPEAQPEQTELPQSEQAAEQPTESVEPTQPIEAAQPVDVEQTVEPAQPVRVEQPIESEQPVEVATPVEVEQPVEIEQPVEVAQPADIAAETVRVAQGAHVAGDDEAAEAVAPVFVEVRKSLWERIKEAIARWRQHRKQKAQQTVGEADIDQEAADRELEESLRQLKQELKQNEIGSEQVAHIADEMDIQEEELDELANLPQIVEDETAHAALTNLAAQVHKRRNYDPSRKKKRYRKRLAKKLARQAQQNNGNNN